MESDHIVESTLTRRNSAATSSTMRAGLAEIHPLAAPHQASVGDVDRQLRMSSDAQRTAMKPVSARRTATLGVWNERNIESNGAEVKGTNRMAESHPASIPRRSHCTYTR